MAIAAEVAFRSRDLLWAGRKPLYLQIQYAAADRGGATSTIEMEPQRNTGWIR